MVEVLKKEYWSKSQVFLLPLTGLTKSQKYDIKSYLYWNDYSIENYNLILRFRYTSYEEFLKYAKRVIFPTLDKNGYLIETHDFDNETVMVLDMSEWARDIEMFLLGKYSRMSGDAKDIIMEFHTFYEKGYKIMIEISAALNPNDKFPLLGNMTAIEYVAEQYELNLEELKKIGELGGIYDKDKETLIHESELRKEGDTLV